MKIKTHFIRGAPLRHYGSKFIDLVLPPQSLHSRTLTGATGLQGDMWDHIRFLDEPCCAACGFPFEFTVAADSLCGNCSAKRPVYDRARSAFAYDENSRAFVLAFKHGGRTEGLRFFTGQMRRAGRTFWPAANFLVPVPLHPSRLIKRRFNQSALLARALARTVPARFDPDILFRTRATASQGAQTAKGRYRNVQGAFTVPPKAKPRLRGQHVVLVDDVMTTGATIDACARALKKAGAAHIDVITLGRVVRQQIPA